MQTNDVGIPNGNAPEFIEFRDVLSSFEKEWSAMQNSIGGVTSSKPLVVNIQEKTIDDLVGEANERINSESTECRNSSVADLYKLPISLVDGQLLVF